MSMLYEEHPVGIVERGAPSVCLGSGRQSLHSLDQMQHWMHRTAGPEYGATDASGANCELRFPMTVRQLCGGHKWNSWFYITMVSLGVDRQCNESTHRTPIRELLEVIPEDVRRLKRRLSAVLG